MDDRDSPYIEPERKESKVKFRILMALVIFIWVSLFFTMLHADFGWGAVAPQPLPTIGQPSVPTRPTFCSSLKGYPREACSRVNEWLAAFDRSDWKKMCSIFSAAYHQSRGGNYAKCVSFFSRQSTSFQTSRISYRIIAVAAKSGRAVVGVEIGNSGDFITLTRQDDGLYHIDSVRNVF